MKKYLIIAFLFLMTGIQNNNLHSQETLKIQLFDEVEKLIERAKDKSANIYSPRSFEKGIEYYKEAEDYFKRGKNLEDIREKVENAKIYLSKAIDGCVLGEVTFSAVMAARADAISAGASTYSPELWKEAEKKLLNAGRELESGYLGDAKEEASHAEQLFRAAELEAIKANFLGPARDLIAKAEKMDVEDNAKKTLNSARRYTIQVENLLKQNRYDTDEARQLAQEAKYEASHAIYLNEYIKNIKKEGLTWEDVILTNEAQVKRISAELGFLSRFDNGFDPAVSEIIKAIRVRDENRAQYIDSIRMMKETINQKNFEIANLKQQIDLMQSRLGNLSDAEKKLQDEGKDLQRRLELKNEQELTIRRVANMFTEEEGNVIREGDEVIIRLYGLTFPVGKDVIEPQYFTLLKKVQDVIKKFPNCIVRIEGHTDSQGSDDVNLVLSERRAKSVAEYLMANMGVEIPINHQGFGESRPIASNDTPEGRAKNRRIDVVIIPSWAGKK